MTTNDVRLEVLVEEPSARQALEHLVPRIVPGVRHAIREFAGKDRLLQELPSRLRGYPRVPVSLGEQARYRDPDAIAGGTWEALGRVLANGGYQTSGLNKLRTASDVAPHVDVEANRSRSFQVFRDGLRRMLSEERDAQA